MRYFKLEEFDCTFTGKNKMDAEFLYEIDDLRGRCGFPFVITSGYRDPSHPVEADKEQPGRHAEGIAADIAVSNGSERRTIVQEALSMGFGGIGVAKDFVHVDLRKSGYVMWSY